MKETIISWIAGWLTPFDRTKLNDAEVYSRITRSIATPCLNLVKLVRGSLEHAEVVRVLEHLKIIYCATPARVTTLESVIQELVRPVHPQTSFRSTSDRISGRIGSEIGINKP